MPRRHRGHDRRDRAGGAQSPGQGMRLPSAPYQRESTAHQETVAGVRGCPPSGGVA
jgi:hypothetical protein